MSHTISGARHIITLCVSADIHLTRHAYILDLNIASSHQDRQLGFWACWSLTVGIMIGSGIFLLPAVLAPYGMLSFAGWLITGGGSVLLALVFARLASRTRQSGGVYIYTRDAFGDLAGFLVAWGYWTCYWIAIPAMALAFVGYLAVFFPHLAAQPLPQALIALALMWVSIYINIRGLKEATSVQLLMTIFKLIPLLLIIGLALISGSTSTLPETNPKQLPLFETLTATALLTMWAFSGMEAGAMPAGDVKDAERTVPRAIVLGTLTVAFIYIALTAAVMSLVSASELANSTAPFSAAAAGLGDWGPELIAVGALVSTAGALHGTTFVAGHIPMAVALDKLAPAWFAQRNSGGSPTLSLLLVGVLATILLLANYSRGLIEMFTFLVMMSTLAFMVPMLVCSLAEFIYSRKSTKLWTAVALIAMLYSAFAILGSGFTTILWGLLFMTLGVPLFYLLRSAQK